MTSLRAAVPRLRALACSDSLRVYLAAERSLEDIDGAEADEALAACVECWHDQASASAAYALLSRDRERLREALLRSRPGEDCLRLKGIYLAELGDPQSVPILCQTVGEGWGALHPRDPEMFDAIERLATADDLPAVEGILGRHSRFLDLDRAREVVTSVRQTSDVNGHNFVLQLPDELLVALADCEKLS